MRIRILLACLLFQTSLSVLADSHTEAALAHIKATDLQTTFKITRDGVLARVDAYGVQLRSNPVVGKNLEAGKLTDDFISETKRVAEEVYAWENVEGMYVSALKETYAEDELIQINSWLVSEYGKLFIAKQKKFMLKTIDITNVAGQLFKNRIDGAEKAYLERISKLSNFK